MPTAPRLRPPQVAALHQLGLLRADLQLAAIKKPIGIDIAALLEQLEPSECAELDFKGFNGMYASFESSDEAASVIERHAERWERDLRSMVELVVHGSRHGVLLVDLLPGYERLHLIDHKKLDALAKIPKADARETIDMTRSCLHLRGALALLDRTIEENAARGVRSKVLEVIRPIVLKRWSRAGMLLAAITKTCAVSRPPHPFEEMALDWLMRSVLERKLMERAGFVVDTASDPITAH